MSQYATAEETAALVRQASPQDKWLEGQLNRISPERHEMGSPAPALAYLRLALELKDTNTLLQGEAKVMRDLLEKSLTVLETIDEDDAHERALLWEFKQKIIAVVEMQLVRP
jgi:hypothetical protein